MSAMNASTASIASSAAIDIIFLPLDELSLRVTNPNHMDEGRVEQLSKNILNEGFLQPILVRPIADERYEIVDGAHRFRAAKKAGVDQVPAIVREMTDAQAALLQIAMNRLRGELNITTVGHMLDKLLESGSVAHDDELLVSGYTHAEIDRLVKSVRQPTTDDVLDGSGGFGHEDEDTGAPPTILPFLLELQFATRDELVRIKRKLRKAAGGGRTADLAKGLINLIDAE